MRPVTIKLYSKIGDKGMSRDEVLEFFDRLDPSEKKKSFPDDCLFQSNRYFADTILKEMLRQKVIKIIDNRYYKNEKKKKEKEDDPVRAD
jgi:hypothetical protein